MNKSKYGYRYITPFFIIFTIFVAIPLIYTFIISFFNYGSNYPTEFVGFANYKKVLQDETFRDALGNTLIIWGINFSVQMILALLVSTLLMDVRLRIKGQGFFRTMFFLPNLMTAASVAFLFALMLDTDSGAINQILGRTIPWLENGLLAQFSVGMIGAWMWFGNTTIIVMAGMTSVPRSTYESVWLDGANRFQIFRDITVPSIKPILYYVFLTSLIGGLQNFDIPYLITNGLGAPDGNLMTMAMYLYLHGFVWDNVGYAAAISYIMFTVIVGFSLLLTFLMRERKGTK